MKKLTIIAILSLLTACFGEPKFDSSSQESIKKSAEKIVKSLPVGEQQEFKKATMYFSIGGEKGFKSMMKAAESGQSPDVTAEQMMSTNLASLNGLTGQEILTKYRDSLEQDRIKRKQRDAVEDLEDEAKKLLENNKFKEAVAKYNAMIDMPFGADKAKSGLEEANSAMAAFATKMEYIEKVKLTEFVAKRIDTYSDKGVPAVRISLKNTGDKSLDKVKVVIYFQDKEGNTIFEEDYHPVLVSKYSFGDNKPLKPGYVKEMEKGQYYTIESALSEWEEGKAIAKVVDIEFSE